MKKTFLALLTLTFPLFLFAAETPLSTIRKVHGLLSRYDESSPQAAALKKEINQYFALDLMARNAIKDHWDKMNSKQRQEYMKLMFDLLEKAVYTDTHENLQKGKVRYKNQRVTGTRGTVMTNIYIADDDVEVDNDFIMRLTGGLWVVQDIFIDGASLTEDYRSQFNKIILEHGMDGSDQALFARLRKAATEDSDDWRKNKKTKEKREPLLEKERTTRRRPTLLEKK